MGKILTTSALLTVMATGAYAIPFVGDFAVSGDAFSDPGLVVHTNPQNGGLNFDLEVGDSITFGLFDIWTEEGTINDDDTVPQSINVAFNFTNPVTSGTGEGESVGNTAFWGFFQWGEVSWNNPTQLTWGNTGVLELSLSDETFNFGKWWGLKEGERKGATVELTAKYVSADIAPVPLPASGLLLIGGLGGLAAFARRRRKAA